MARKTNFEVNGSNYYRVTATIGKDPDGKPLRKQFYGSSKKDAEAKRDEYMLNIGKGLSVGYDRIMFLKAFMLWFNECCAPNVSKSTYVRYEAVVRLHIQPFECLNKKLVDIRGLDMQMYYNELYDTRTPSQVECVHCLLSSFFKYALKEDYITKNPMVSVALKKTQDISKEVEVFTKSEIERIIAASSNKIEHLIFYFALATGLRQGEILA